MINKTDIDIENASTIFAAMGNKGRLKVLVILESGPKTVTELNKMIALSQSALSQQLAILRKTRLVSTTREGTCIRYELNAENKNKIRRLLKTVL